MMEKRVQDLNDAIAQTAKDKKKAVASRSQGQSADKESCRIIYLEACQQIAASFKPDGFRNAKSRQRMTRIVGEWRQYISFQSSRDNVAGARIALWVHANVGNTQLQQWRKANNSRFQSDAVGGGQLGNLSRPARWFDWDLTDAEQRARVVDEVIADLRRIALPYFGQFESVDSLVADLLNDAVSKVRASNPLLSCCSAIVVQPMPPSTFLISCLDDQIFAATSRHSPKNSGRRGCRIRVQWAMQSNLPRRSLSFVWMCRSLCIDDRTILLFFSLATRSGQPAFLALA